MMDIVNDKISIIVPIYNGEKYLESTINRIRRSFYKNIEIILIDDGSKDTSYEICKKLAIVDNRIVLYHQENKGIVSARNKGVELSTGKYISFCDQDDIVKEEMYLKMYEIIKREKVKLCLCSTGKYINEIEEEYESYEDEILDKKNILKKIIYPIIFDGYAMKSVEVVNHRVAGTIWKCLIEKRVIINHKISFRRFLNYEDDLLFLFDILASVEKVATIKFRGYLWRINSESESYRWKYIRLFEMKQEKYYNYLCEILNKFDVPNTLKTEFRNFFYCNFIVELIDNEGSPQNIKKYNQKIKYLKEYIYMMKNYDEIINAQKNISLGLVKKKVMLMLVKHKKIRTAYLFNFLYRNLKKECVKFAFWSKLEKKIRSST